MAAHKRSWLGLGGLLGLLVLAGCTLSPTPTVPRPAVSPTPGALTPAAPPTAAATDTPILVTATPVAGGPEPPLPLPVATTSPAPVPPAPSELPTAGGQVPPPAEPPVAGSEDPMEQAYLAAVAEQNARLAAAVAELQTEVQAPVPADRDWLRRTGTTLGTIQRLVAEARARMIPPRLLAEGLAYQQALGHYDRAIDLVARGINTQQPDLLAPAQTEIAAGAPALAEATGRLQALVGLPLPPTPVLPAAPSPTVLSVEPPTSLSAPPTPTLPVPSPTTGPAAPPATPTPPPPAPPSPTSTLPPTATLESRAVPPTATLVPGRPLPPTVTLVAGRPPPPPIIPPGPPPAPPGETFASGGLGLSKMDWDRVHFVKSHVRSTWSYDDGTYMLTFWTAPDADPTDDSPVLTVRRVWAAAGGADLAAAQAEGQGLIPIDAQLVQTITQAPGLVQIYVSPALTARYPAIAGRDPWRGEKPGTFTITYSGEPVTFLEMNLGGPRS